jgi:hypothetical protein
MNWPPPDFPSTAHDWLFILLLVYAFMLLVVVPVWLWVLGRVEGR